jgi:hypothetical protein
MQGGFLPPTAIGYDVSKDFGRIDHPGDDDRQRAGAYSRRQL